MEMERKTIYANMNILHRGKETDDLDTHVELYALYTTHHAKHMATSTAELIYAQPLIDYKN